MFLLASRIGEADTEKTGRPRRKKEMKIHTQRVAEIAEGTEKRPNNEFSASSAISASLRESC
jgi:hypothetical protein